MIPDNLNSYYGELATNRLGASADDNMRQRASDRTRSVQVSITSATTDYPAPYRLLIASEAKKRGLDPRLVLAIMKQGGIKVSDDLRLMPDPILTGRNAEKLKALAETHGPAVTGKALKWTTDLSAPLKRIAEVVTKRGLIVLLSDFLAPLETLERDLIALAACGHEIVIFQMLDPAELSFKFDSAAMFQDMESGRMLFIDPSAARTEYNRKLEAHCAALRGACQRLGIACHRLSTERPLEMALFDFLRARMQRRRGVQRAGHYATRSQTRIVSSKP